MHGSRRVFCSTAGNTADSPRKRTAISLFFRELQHDKILPQSLREGQETDPKKITEFCIDKKT